MAELAPPAAVAAPEVIDFLRHLEVEKRTSPHTLDAYRRDLRAFAAWAQGQGIAEPARIDNAGVRAFIAAEHRRGLAPKSLQRRLSACRSFYRWLLRHGRIQADPSAGIRAPKAARKLPQVLDPDEAKALVEVPTDVPLGLRDRAILELFYSSGLRLAELCALRWRDLQLDDGLVTVLGKGSKQRSVPVGSHARRALAEWRAETGAAADAPVFPGRGGGPITPRAVQLRLRLLAQRQGLFKRVHPHLLRHSFASHVLESSGDLRGVQELLGHADIATTQIYTHLDFQHLAKVYDAAHPRARRKPEKS
ncbi:tyrosine recombinase XerC [Luteimonas sp. RD2P54]|uniref:Tyrosine recombinase XerC n=1 Tax=Luteimonas endophytica TaxID=3042023 RepID=A0ABT6J4K6_9GAMM|nr:tyrosine recombinase XerC [Luteimonas endophytica]MDH5821744.1 tyrosine recombinase XerC [Luteimonas endophytica]